MIEIGTAQIDPAHTVNPNVPHTLPPPRLNTTVDAMLVENLTGLGLASFWVALALRLPEVVRQREFRNMYFSVVALGLSVTLYYRPIALFLAELFGSARPCNLGMNLWGILTSGVVAALVARELKPRALKVVYRLSGLAFVSIALMGLSVSQGSTGCATNLDLPWWDPYWWLICAAWIGSMSCAVLLCARNIQTAAGSQVLTAAMLFFLIGFGSILVFWLGIFGFLTFRPTWVLAALPVVLLCHVWSHTIGLLIGVAASAVSWIRLAVTMGRRLWLLERLQRYELLSGIPVSAPARSGLWRDFLGNARLGLYRAEVQILDSLALLGDQRFVGRLASDDPAGVIVEYSKSAECLGDDGAVVFEKLEAYVRKFDEESMVRGDLPDR